MKISLKLRNSLASAGSAFFAALVGISLAGAYEAFWVGFVAAGMAFFATYGTNGNGPKEDRA